MKYWVGVTDKNWYLHLHASNPDEVNFWQPSATPPATFFQSGTPFLFKLHYPDNFIVGGGFPDGHPKLPHLWPGQTPAPEQVADAAKLRG